MTGYGRTAHFDCVSCATRFGVRFRDLIATRGYYTCPHCGTHNRTRDEWVEYLEYALGLPYDVFEEHAAFLRAQVAAAEQEVLL